MSLKLLFSLACLFVLNSCQTLLAPHQAFNGEIPPCRGEFLQRIGPAANLENADLSGLDLREQNLASACMNGADLSGTNFNYGSLVAADLIGADLNGASFYCTDLTSADLRGAHHLTQKQLKHAFGSAARLPPRLYVRSTAMAKECPNVKPRYSYKAPPTKVIRKKAIIKKTPNERTRKKVIIDRNKTYSTK